MAIQIRPARPADIVGIFHVRTSVIENSLTLTELAEMGITEPSVSEMIGGSECAWVACEDTQIVGFCMIDPDEGSVFAAFVLPTREGRGIGKMLVQIAEKALFSQHTRIWLETSATSRAAGFYRHLGWGNDLDIGGGDVRLEKCLPAELLP